MDYQNLLAEAMLEVVKKVLIKVQNSGLLKDHFFYISFITNHPLVILSPKMKNRYPEEITIVLQHQFEDLKVEKEGFSVKLSFDKQPEVIYIPFNCITSFTDPSVNFSLQFKQQINQEVEKILSATFEKETDNKSTKQKNRTNLKEEKISGEIISLDKFRNKNKPI